MHRYAGITIASGRSTIGPGGEAFAPGTTTRMIETTANSHSAASTKRHGVRWSGSALRRIPYVRALIPAIRAIADSGVCSIIGDSAKAVVRSAPNTAKAQARPGPRVVALRVTPVYRHAGRFP